MSGNRELGRGLRTREKNATEGGAGRFEKTAPDARAAPPEAHESLIGRKAVEEVPLTGLSSSRAASAGHLSKHCPTVTIQELPHGDRWIIAGCIIQRLPQR